MDSIWRTTRWKSVSLIQIFCFFLMKRNAEHIKRNLAVWHWKKIQWTVLSYKLRDLFPGPSYSCHTCMTLNDHLFTWVSWFFFSKNEGVESVGLKMLTLCDSKWGRDGFCFWFTSRKRAMKFSYDGELSFTIFTWN